MHTPGPRLDAAHPEIPAAPGGVSSGLTPPLRGTSPSGSGAARRGGRCSTPAGPPPAPHSSCSENKSPGASATRGQRFKSCAHLSLQDTNTKNEKDINLCLLVCVFLPPCIIFPLECCVYKVEEEGHLLKSDVKNIFFKCSTVLFCFTAFFPLLNVRAIVK